MFGLFKDKKKELAKEIYGVFKPKIEFVKVTGKWESNLSIGDVLIGDDYLLGFLVLEVSIRKCLGSPGGNFLNKPSHPSTAFVFLFLLE